MYSSSPLGMGTGSFWSGRSAWNITCMFFSASSMTFISLRSNTAWAGVARARSASRKRACFILFALELMDQVLGQVLGPLIEAGRDFQAVVLELVLELRDVAGGHVAPQHLARGFVDAGLQEAE